MENCASRRLAPHVGQLNILSFLLAFWHNLSFSAIDSQIEFYRVPWRCSVSVKPVELRPGFVIALFPLIWNITPSNVSQLKGEIQNLVNLFSYIYLLQGKSLGGTSISFTEENQFFYQLQKLENFQAELKQFLPCLSIILL